MPHKCFQTQESLTTSSWCLQRCTRPQTELRSRQACLKAVRLINKQPSDTCTSMVSAKPRSMTPKCTSLYTSFPLLHQRNAQHSQVEELSALTSRLFYLTPDLTLSEFHPTATCSSGGDSGQCGCVFGQLSLCTVFTGAPQAAVRRRQIVAWGCRCDTGSCQNRQGKASFKCDLHRQVWVFVVCGRYFPFWRTFSWYDLGPQVL